MSSGWGLLHDNSSFGTRDCLFTQWIPDYGGVPNLRPSNPAVSKPIAALARSRGGLDAEAPRLEGSILEVWSKAIISRASALSQSRFTKLLKTLKVEVKGKKLRSRPSYAHDAAAGSVEFQVPAMRERPRISSHNPFVSRPTWKTPRRSASPDVVVTETTPSQSI
jgi:hypothetical protein